MCMSVSGTIAEYHYDRSILTGGKPNDLGILHHNWYSLPRLVPVPRDYHPDG